MCWRGVSMQKRLLILTSLAFLTGCSFNVPDFLGRQGGGGGTYLPSARRPDPATGAGAARAARGRHRAELLRRDPAGRGRVADARLLRRDPATDRRRCAGRGPAFSASSWLRCRPTGPQAAGPERTRTLAAALFFPHPLAAPGAGLPGDRRRQHPDPARALDGDCAGPRRSAACRRPPLFDRHDPDRISPGGQRDLAALEAHGIAAEHLEAPAREERHLGRFLRGDRDRARSSTRSAAARHSRPRRGAFSSTRSRSDSASAPGLRPGASANDRDVGPQASPPPWLWRRECPRPPRPGAPRAGAAAICQAPPACAAGSRPAPAARRP